MATFSSDRDIDATLVTDGDVETGDVAGIDVGEGWASDDSLGGMGTKLDALPGDELPVSRIAITEQDRDALGRGIGAGEPGSSGVRADVDMDDSQTTAASSRPVYGKDT